jgi:hypothetical protein
MFRSYDHLQVENILLAGITQLTTDPLFYNIVNIIVLGLITSCLVDVVAVLGDVFCLVYNFHMPLSLKVKLAVQWSRCVGLMAIFCGVNVLLRFPFCWCVFCCFSAVVWCVSAAGGVLRVQVLLCVVSFRGNTE